MSGKGFFRHVDDVKTEDEAKKGEKFKSMHILSDKLKKPFTKHDQDNAKKVILPIKDSNKSQIAVAAQEMEKPLSIGGFENGGANKKVYVESEANKGFEEKEAGKLEAVKEFVKDMDSAINKEAKTAMDRLSLAVPAVVLLGSYIALAASGVMPAMLSAYVSAASLLLYLPVAAVALHSAGKVLGGEEIKRSTRESIGHDILNNVVEGKEKSAWDTIEGVFKGAKDGIKTTYDSARNYMVGGAVAIGASAVGFAISQGVAMAQFYPELSTILPPLFLLGLWAASYGIGKDSVAKAASDKIIKPEPNYQEAIDIITKMDNVRVNQQ